MVGWSLTRHKEMDQEDLSDAVEEGVVGGDQEAIGAVEVVQSPREDADTVAPNALWNHQIPSHCLRARNML